MYLKSDPTYPLLKIIADLNGFWRLWNSLKQLLLPLKTVPTFKMNFIH